MAARGNKSYLPSKTCAGCGRIMVWRKKWARNWPEVRHCSQRCRAKGQNRVIRAPLE